MWKAENNITRPGGNEGRKDTEMMMTHPTLEEIREMERKRLERAKELLEKATDEKERRMLKKRIWMLQNS